MKNFNELGLAEPLLQAIEELGYEHPMPVQEEVIPYLLNNDTDLVALAQTGTGKTAAYGLPLLQRTLSQPLPCRERSDYHSFTEDFTEDTIGDFSSPNKGEVGSGSGGASILILSPTRELCLQIADDMEGFSKYLPETEIVAVYGGTNIEPQIRALRHGADIIVATPGRLMDLMNRGVADLSKVQYVVLDEADEMLSMGFQEELDSILAGIPSQHRNLLFSATMSREIERIAQNYLTDAKQIQVGSRNEGAENVNHIYYMVHARDKYLALKRVVDFYPRIYAIIFCRTRLETQEVADNLIRDGYNADALHGELSQQQRELTMQKFRRHRIQLLVATDVAARGLDVDDLTHVINYGMPDDVEYYTHRSGRTGRAGKKGTSICIIGMREKSKIKHIEKEIQKTFEQGTLPEPRDICTKQLYHVIDDIERIEVDEEEIAPFMEEVQKRWEWLDKTDLIKRVLSREFGRFLQYYANAPEITPPQTPSRSPLKGEKRGARGSLPLREGRGGSEGYVRLFLNIGKIDGMYAREIISLLNKNVQGDKVAVGRIDLMKNFSFIEVKQDDLNRVLKGLKHGVTVKGRSVVCDVATEAQTPSVSPSKGRKKENTSFKEQESASTKLSYRRKKSLPTEGQAGRGSKPSREERGYTAPRGKKYYKKEDWMKFLHPDKSKENGLKGEIPDFSEEGWARRKPKKNK
ncbi:MAG: DEAD/DEAH box helicase [Bacteroidaceae bacterium]|nr:DEAD/DEAH box helicase [Bacteroidaceae bacterium]